MGDGPIEIRRIREAVDAAGYTGPIEVEIFNEDIWNAPGDEVLRSPRSGIYNMPEGVTNAVPKALYLLDGEAFEKIYGDEERAAVAELVDVYAPRRRLIPWRRTLTCSRRPR